MPRAGFLISAAAIGLLTAAQALGAHMVWTTPAATTRIAPGVYVRVGECAEATPSNADGIANTGFVVGRDSVAVIDPGGSLADGQRLRAAVRDVTSLPIRAVIFTHVHPDHVFGAAAFLADHPDFWGHVRLPSALAARGAYDKARLAAVLGAAEAGDVVMPTRLVANEDRIDLGGRVLRLRAFGVAHTDTDLAVLDTGSGTLWTGDLVFSGRVPSLDGDLKGWIAELGALEAIGAARAVPGHGPASIAWPSGDADERRYLQTLLHDVRAAIARGLDVDQAVGTAGLGERSKWAMFDEYNGRNVTVAYKELQWE